SSVITPSVRSTLASPGTWGEGSSMKSSRTMRSTSPWSRDSYARIRMAAILAARRSDIVAGGMSEPGKKDGHAPPAGGAARARTALKALMCRGEEADPRLRSTICSFGVLDCAPDWQRFLAACEWGTRMVPRFRQKVVESVFGLGHPRSEE